MTSSNVLNDLLSKFQKVGAWVLSDVDGISLLLDDTKYKTYECGNYIFMVDDVCCYTGEFTGMNFITRMRKYVTGITKAADNATNLRIHHYIKTALVSGKQVDILLYLPPLECISYGIYYADTMKVEGIISQYATPVWKKNSKKVVIESKHRPNLFRGRDEETGCIELQSEKT